MVVKRAYPIVVVKRGFTVRYKDRFGLSKKPKNNEGDRNWIQSANTVSVSLG